MTRKTDAQLRADWHDSPFLERLAPKIPKKPKLSPAQMLIATIAFIMLLLTVRSLGWLQGIELYVLDRLQQFSPSQHTDITLIESKTPAIAHKKLATVLNHLQVNKPAIIGLNLYLPEEKDPELKQALKSENIVGSHNFQTKQMPYTKYTGFAGGLIDDSDRFVRRANIGGRNNSSFGYMVAVRYLQTLGIEESPGQLGELTLRYLVPNSGGYRSIDVKDSQFIINAQRLDTFRRFSTQDLLQGKVPHEAIDGKLVVIGRAMKDDEHTTIFKGTTGMTLEATIAYQFIQASMGKSPLISKFLPDFVEHISVIIIAALVVLIARSKHQIVPQIRLVAVILIGPYILFQYGFWLPIASLVLSQLGTIITIYLIGPVLLNLKRLKSNS